MERKLNNSLLFKSLLGGYEIRYSDFIGFLIQRYKYTPWNIERTGPNMYREWNNLDIYVTEDIAKNKIEYPVLVIENKLKSLPSENQLKEYTNKVLKDLLNKFKKELRNNSGKARVNKLEFADEKERFIKKIDEISFVLLTPIKDNDRQVDITLPFDDHETRTVTWHNKTYGELADDIRKRLLNQPLEPYEKYLINDFVTILTDISNAQIPQITAQLDSKISAFFKPTDEFLELGLSDLYSKYQASQCAHYLYKELESLIPDLEWVENWSVDSLFPNKPVIKYDFSSRNKSGLFEIVNKISDEKVFVIQYENGVLKKGLIVLNDQASSYREWFLEEWILPDSSTVHFKGKINNDTEFYRYRYNTSLSFYYSKSNVSVYSVKDVMYLFKQNILHSNIRK